VIYLLDTNTFSEAAKAEPNRHVLSRMVARQFDWATSATAWEEFTCGVRALPATARRKRLEDYRRNLVDAGLVVLPFDQRAAEWMAGERARLLKKGMTPPYRDAQIAAVAATQDLTLVTRNTQDYRTFRGLRMENWFA
jgi:tRNA(fMet)-specific endonuclease VapC